MIVQNHLYAREKHDRKYESGGLLRAQCKAEIREGALDVLQALLAQAFNCKKIVFAFAHQAADGAYRGIVERHFNALREIQFTNARLEHFGIHWHAPVTFFRALAFRSAGLHHIKLFFPKADDRLELMNHGLDRMLERLARRDRPVGFDEHAQAIEISAVADAHVLYLIVDAANRTEDRIERDSADINALLLMRLLRNVA